LKFAGISNINIFSDQIPNINCNITVVIRGINVNYRICVFIDFDIFKESQIEIQIYLQLCFSVNILIKHHIFCYINIFKIKKKSFMVLKKFHYLKLLNGNFEIQKFITDVKTDVTYLMFLIILRD